MNYLSMKCGHGVCIYTPHGRIHYIPPGSEPVPHTKGKSPIESVVVGEEIPHRACVERQAEGYFEIISQPYLASYGHAKIVIMVFLPIVERNTGTRSHKPIEPISTYRPHPLVCSG